MHFVACFLSFLLFLLASGTTKEKKCIEIGNFEKLMGLKSAKLKRFGDDDIALLNRYKSFYLKRCLALQFPGNETKVPKVFHFIWVGPKKFPETSLKNVISWQKHNPDWKIKFWTDSESRESPLPFMERHFINEIPFQLVREYLSKTENYGEQSDLIRYEILYHEGGVYLDHDIECFESLDNLVAHFDFFAPFEPLHESPIKTSEWTITNCLIGSKPHHPILKKTLQNIKDHWEYWSNTYSAEDRATVLRRVLHRTFKPFGNAVNEHLGKGDEFILPAAMIFPSYYSRRTEKQLKENHLALANHKWENTWFKDVPLTMEERLFDEIQKIKRQGQSLHKKLHLNKLLGWFTIAIQLYLIGQVWYWKRKKVRS